MLPRIKNMKFTAKLSKNILLKLALVFGSIFGVFLMTGLLYFRNDVYITDNGETKQAFTMNSDPYEILKENNYSLGQYDKIEFIDFTDDIAEINIKRAFEVPVSIDGKETTVYNVDSTVQQLLEQFDISLEKYDSISPKLGSRCTDGTKIVIKRAFDVTVTADGKSVTVKALDNTTEEICKRAGITLGADDITSIPLDTVITKTTDIVVQRVKYVDYFTTKITPFKTTTVKDNLKVIGDNSVNIKGVNGETKINRRKTYIDGVEVSNKVVSTEVVSEVVDEVIGEGAALATPYSKVDDSVVELENGLPIDYKYVVSGKATAYTAGIGAKTASGRYAEIGTVAVNPNVIPYGSKVYIVTQDGSHVYGYAVAADTGDGMMDGSIPVDLYMGPTVYNYGDACSWGLKYVDIYVLEVGNG